MNIALLVKKSKYYHWDIYHVLLDAPFKGYEEIILAFNSSDKWLDFHKVSDYDFNARVFTYADQFHRINESENFDKTLARVGYRLIRSSTEL